MNTAALRRRSAKVAAHGSRMAAAAVSAIAAGAAVAAGTVVGFMRRRSPAFPGLAGALAVSWAVGEVTGHIFGHGLTPWVAMLTAGFFALRLDGQITLSAPRNRGG